MKINSNFVILSIIIITLEKILAQTSRRTTMINASTSTIKGVTIRKDETFGNYLADYDGYTLYVNVKDGAGQISCYSEACIKTWPPAVIYSDQKLYMGDDVNGNMLTIMKGDDDRNALLFNNYALYYYVNDANPGEKKGIGLESTYYLISDKGIPLKRDTEGNLPQERPSGAAANATEEVSDGVPSGKSLKVTGLASLVILPDVAIIRLSLTANATTLQSTMTKLNSLMSSLNSTLGSISSIQPNDITLIDRTIKNEGDALFTVVYTYNIMVTNPQNLNQITNALNSLNGDKNILSYDIYYAPSIESLKKAKTFLYSQALKNAMENAYNSIDPLNMRIEKDRPIRSITLDSSSFKSLLPFNTIMNPKLFLPSLNRGADMSFTVKVTVIYNIR